MTADKWDNLEQALDRSLHYPRLGRESADYLSLIPMLRSELDFPEVRPHLSLGELSFTIPRKHADLRVYSEGQDQYHITSMTRCAGVEKHAEYSVNRHDLVATLIHEINRMKSAEVDEYGP